MSFTKTTTRALAASIAIVAAGATVAAAAVFQLPILGFGSPAVASASATPVKPTTTVAPRKVVPRIIVKTRYVDDIVHRRAVASARVPAPSYTPLASTVRSATTLTAPAPRTSTVPAAAVAPVRMPTTTTTASATWTDDAHGEHYAETDIPDSGASGSANGGATGDK